MATEAITYSSQVPNVQYASGLLTSDGTIANIELGFTPKKITLFNITATNPTIYFWVKGLAVDNCIKINGADGVVTKAVTAIAVYGDTEDDTSPDAAANDAVQYVNGDSSSFRGFSIPDALLSDNDSYVWEAWG